MTTEMEKGREQVKVTFFFLGKSKFPGKKRQ